MDPLDFSELFIYLEYEHRIVNVGQYNSCDVLFPLQEHKIGSKAYSLNAEVNLCLCIQMPELMQAWSSV